MREEIRVGSHAVIISSNEPSGPFRATYYVNVPTAGSIADGDITTVFRKFQTVSGARKWAAKELAMPRQP